MQTCDESGCGSEAKFFYVDSLYELTNTDEWEDIERAVCGKHIVEALRDA